MVEFFFHPPPGKIVLCSTTRIVKTTMPLPVPSTYPQTVLSSRSGYVKKKATITELLVALRQSNKALRSWTFFLVLDALSIMKVLRKRLLNGGAQRFQMGKKFGPLCCGKRCER